MIAMLSGKRATYALAARVTPPHRTSTMLQTRLLGANARDEVPARPIGCAVRALRRKLTESGCSSWEVAPCENWAERTGRAALATHLVEAVA